MVSSIISNASFKTKNLYFFSEKNLLEKSSLSKLSLSVVLRKDLSMKSLVKVYSLLEIITGQRPSFVRAKTHSVFFKRRKGAPVGVKVTLRGLKSEKFIYLLLWQVLPKQKEVSFRFGASKYLEGNSGFNFLIEDPLLFEELKNLYFFFKGQGPIRVTGHVKTSNKHKTFFFSRFFKLPYKNLH